MAQIYEEEYQSAASGSKVKDPRDVKLSKEHDEIESIWNEICYKLDALSSLNFVPKQVSCAILSEAPFIVLLSFVFTLKVERILKC